MCLPFTTGDPFGQRSSFGTRRVLPATASALAPAPPRAAERVPRGSRFPPAATPAGATVDSAAFPTGIPNPLPRSGSQARRHASGLLDNPSQAVDKA